MRSLRDIAIITLLTNPENHYEDTFPEGSFYKTLCDNFLLSYRRLQIAFDLLETNIPVEEIQLHTNGAIDLLDFMNKLKKTLSPRQFLILAIYTGVGVDVNVKRQIYLHIMSQDEQLKLFRMARKMVKLGDHFLMSILKIVAYQKRLDAASDVTRAIVRQAVELDSFSTLRAVLKNLENTTHQSLDALFADLPCKPSKKIETLIRTFINCKQGKS